MLTTKQRFQKTRNNVFIFKIFQLIIQSVMVYHSFEIKEENLEIGSTIINSIAMIMNSCFIFFTMRNVQAEYIYRQELLVAGIFGSFYGSSIIFFSYFYWENVSIIFDNTDSFQINNKLFESRRIEFFKTIAALVIILFLEFPILYLTYVMKLLIREIKNQVILQQELLIQDEELVQQQQLVQQHVQQILNHPNLSNFNLSSNDEQNAMQQDFNAFNRQLFAKMIETNRLYRKMKNNLNIINSNLNPARISAQFQDYPNALSSADENEIQPEQCMPNLCTSPHKALEMETKLTQNEAFHREVNIRLLQVCDKAEAQENRLRFFLPDKDESRMKQNDNNKYKNIHEEIELEPIRTQHSNSDIEVVENGASIEIAQGLETSKIKLPIHNKKEESESTMVKRQPTPGFNKDVYE